MLTIAVHSFCSEHILKIWFLTYSAPILLPNQKYWLIYFQSYFSQQSSTICILHRPLHARSDNFRIKFYKLSSTAQISIQKEWTARKPKYNMTLHVPTGPCNARWQGISLNRYDDPSTQSQKVKTMNMKQISIIPEPDPDTFCESFHPQHAASQTSFPLCIPNAF